MGERKVINKYIPADFDPSLVPNGKKLSAKDGTVAVRMMLPFSMQCESCGTFLYRGRKYNSRKEAMGGPDGKYLGITRWRFYIKCNHCARPITFLTDPKNTDYEMESGATRNYELRRDEAQQEEQEEQDAATQAKLDPMKALEDRVLDSQREQADLDNLEEIKAMNARHVQLLKRSGGEDALAGTFQKDSDEEKEKIVELTADDEALVKSIQFGKKEKTIRRLNAQDEAQREAARQAAAEALFTTSTTSTITQPKKSVIPVKIKRKVKAPQPAAAPKHQQQAKSSSLSNLLGGYGSDSSDD